ncbi:MAG TPA: FliA/WhiG family RNA polymerase sigma factor [Epulopiscium sp.]|nr:FliA/WhiG family RNA polymerase sigma factor [Candidatus Epulonipiscium sp.]
MIVSDKEIEKMWQQYALNQSPEIKEKLIIHYAPLVKYIAGRLNMYLGQNVEYDDLISYGVFGLIDAIDKFDLTKEVKFETYASLRIRGSVIDHMRKMDWVPRSLRKQQKDMERAYTQLEHTLGRPATDEEMIGFLEISPEEFNELIKNTSISTLTSLEQHIEQGQSSEDIGSTIKIEESPEEHVEQLEMQEMLKNSINQLPENERKVVTLYYYEELTLKEISAIIGVSESRISQIHTKGISRLRGKLSIEEG